MIIYLLLFLTSCIHASKHDYTLTLGSNTSYPQYIFNRTLRIKCNITGYPNPHIKWYYSKDIQNPKILHEDQAYLVVNPDGKISLPNNEKNKPDDLDTYFCEATNLVGTMRSPKFTLFKVSNVASVRLTYEKSPISKNSKGIMKCVLENEIYHFYQLDHWVVVDNGQTIKVSKTKGRYSVFPTPRTAPQLHVRNLTEKDKDNLKARCVLRHRYNNTLYYNTKEWNTFDNSWTNHNVKIDHCGVTNITVMVGQSVELPVCYGSNVNIQDMHWYVGNYRTKASQILTSWKGSPKYSYSTENRKLFDNLIINHVRMKDAGRYFVRNSRTNEFTSPPIQLNVKKELTVKIWQKRISVYSNKNELIMCTVEGHPISTIYWLHNGKFLKRETKLYNKFYQLKIINVDLSKVGIYQCVTEWRENGRLRSSKQDSVQIFLKSMSPILKSQSPKLPGNTPYSSVTLKDNKDQVDFSCKFAGVPKPNITWYIDDRLIPIVPGLDVNTDGNDRRNLYFVKSNVRIDLSKLQSIGDLSKYGGMFKAVASNGNGTAECYTMVFVHGVFKIRDVAKKVFSHGEPIVLSCNVIAKAEPFEIYWYRIRDGREIRLPETGEERVTFNKRVLTIAKPKKFTKNSGKFKCEAKFSPEKQERVMDITIVSKPKISSEIKRTLYVDLKKQKQANFICRPVSYTDKPWYAWWTIKFNGKTEILIPNRINTSINSFIKISYFVGSAYGTSKLPKGVPFFLQDHPNKYSKIEIIYNDILDEAVLTCHVQNNAGVDSKSSIIHIMNPQFHIKPKSSLTVVVGQSFRVDCVPKKTSLDTRTRWKYSYKVSDQTSNSGASGHTNNTLPIIPYDKVRTTKYRLYQLKNGTLVVNKVTEFDPVQFTCVVRVIPDSSSSNKASTISKVTKITVHVPARISLKSQIDLRRNQPGTIKCNVHGDISNLSITWIPPMHVRNTELQENQYTRGKDTIKSLTIRRVDNSYGGKYRCTARNSYNKKLQSSETTVSIVDIPEEVTTISSGERQARSLVLIWETPSNTGNKPILGYYVKYRPVTIENNQWLKQESNTTRITIKNLRPNTKYEVGIWPYNAIGQGRGNVLKEKFLTKEDAPEGKVQKLKVVAETSTSIKLSWSPPKKSLQNGQLKDYEVCYRQTSPKDDIRTSSITKDKCVTVSYNPKNSTKSFINLPKFTQFEFRVRARNKIGQGPMIAKTVRTMPDFPETKPQQVKCIEGSSQLQGTSLDIQWEPPAASSINGVLKHYQLEYYPTVSGSPLNTSKITKTTATLDKLTPYTKYSIQVRVVNQKGQGPLSHPVECLTGQAPPSLPRAAKAYFNDKCLYVTWLSPMRPNGKIKEYCLKWGNSMEKCFNTRDISNKNDMSNNYGRPFFYKEICDEFNKAPNILKIRAGNQYHGEILSVKVQKTGMFVLSVSRHITVFEGQNVKLDCLLDESSVLGQVQWLTPRKEKLSPNENENGLLLSKPISGRYQCILNDQVLVEHHVTVRSVQKRVPFKPILVYQNSDAHSIFVKWRSQTKNPYKLYSQSDLPPPIKKYHVRWIQKGTRINYTTVVPVTSSHVNITDLTCGVDYQVSIMASNSYGFSEDLVCNIKTMGSRVQFPEKFHIEQYPYSLCFPLYQFLPGDDCPASYFNVTLLPANHGKSISNQNINITQVFTATNLAPNKCQNITNLNADTTYHYNVQAVNGAGVRIMKNTVQTSKPLHLLDITTKPPIIHNHTNSPISPFYITIIVVSVLIVFLCIICACCLYKKRNKQSEHKKPSTIINNNIQKKTQPAPPMFPSLPESRQRKLPSPPRETTSPNNPISTNNVYSPPVPTAAILSAAANNNNQEDQDTVQPYAIYMSHSNTSGGFSSRPMGTSSGGQSKVMSYMPQSHQSLPPQSISNQHHSGMRPTTSVNTQHPTSQHNNNNPANIVSNNNGMAGAYMSGGSQAHSYQYPEHMAPHPHPMQNLNNSNNNSTSRVYSRGYSTGGPGTKVAMLEPSSNSTNPITESEHYRPSSSTTASSAKDELSRIMSDTYTNNISTIQRVPATTITNQQQQRMMTSEPNTIVPNYNTDSVDLGDSISSGPDIGGAAGGTIGRQPGVPSDDPSALLLSSYQPSSVDESVSGGELPVSFTNELQTQNQVLRPITRHSNNFPNSQQFIQPHLMHPNNQNMATVNEEENDNMRFTNDFVVV